MISRQRVLILCAILACGVFAVSCTAQERPTTGPTATADDAGGEDYPTTEVRVFTPPEGGKEAEDFFREVTVFVTWDGRQLEVRGDPAQDCACYPKRCEPNRMREVDGNEEPDPHAGNVMCGIPRVFYPPDGGGIRLTREYRPDEPARQVRWTVRCAAETRDCFEEGDLVLIRAKDENGKPPEGCREPDEEPGCPGQRQPDCPPFQEQMEKISKAKNPNARQPQAAYKEAKEDASKRQQLTLFSPETQGVFAIPVYAAGRRDSDDGRGGRYLGSEASGIPNQPDFSHGPDLGWGYSVELWRDGERLDCLDPDVWVEGDGPGV